MSVTFKKPDPNEFIWITELETAIRTSAPAQMDAVPLLAACAALKASSKELEATMTETHKATMALQSGKAPAAAPGPLPPVPTPLPNLPQPNPVPIPYPTFGVEKTNLRKKVNASELALQKHSMAQQRMEHAVNKHVVQTSNGDAAGTKGVVSVMNKGKAHFRAWSINVKAECKAVTRHLDLSHNLR